MKNLFQIAAKRKYRFQYKGMITVEDLYDLDVKSLDYIYGRLKAEQKNSEQESLLSSSIEDKDLANKIEIIKIIVQEKLAQIERNKRAVEVKAKNQRILEIIADKQDEDMKNKSIEELKAMLENDSSDDGDSDY